MRRPPAWVLWAMLAWFLLEAVVAVFLADWYVNMLIEQARRL